MYNIYIYSEFMQKSWMFVAKFRHQNDAIKKAIRLKEQGHNKVIVKKSKNYKAFVQNVGIDYFGECTYVA